MVRARGGWWVLAGLIPGATAACFSDSATVGAICRDVDDCGRGQACENEVCGRCGNSVADAGEVCFATVPPLAIEAPTGPTTLAAGDFDGDGIVDLVAIVPGQATLWHLAGVGDATFGSPESLTLASSVDHMVVGDLNSDGRPDLAISGPSGVGFVLSAGEDGFAATPFAATEAPPSALAYVASDDAPVVLVGFADPVLPVIAYAAAAAGPPGHAALWTLDDPAPVRAILSGQLDADDTADVVVLRETDVVALLGRDQAALTLGPMSVLGQDLRAGVIVPPAPGTAHLLVFDADGGQLQLAIGDGAGAFAIERPLMTGRSVSSLAVLDLDHRASDDVLVGTRDGGLLALLDREGTFADTVVLRENAVGSVAVALFDRDPLTDIAIGGAAQATIALLRRDP